MKTIMEFNMDEDQETYKVYSQAPKMSVALWEMGSYLRDLDKYGHEFKNVERAIEKIREQFHMYCEDLLDII